MNLKERGITVGDLLLIIIIIITTTMVVKTLNKEKKSTLNLRNQEEISHKEKLFTRIEINHFNL